MFIVREQKSIKWPVKVEVAQPGGTFAEQVFTVEFRRLPEDEYETLLKNLPAAHEQAADGSTAKILERNVGFFAEVIVGWEGVKFEDGSDAPYSPAMLRTLITGADGWVLSVAINNALRELRLGKAREKNW